MALATFDTHNLAAASYMEAAFSPFVSLKLWHLNFFLHLWFLGLPGQNRREHQAHNTPIQRR